MPEVAESKTAASTGRWFFLLCPFVLLGLQAALYGDWVIDDAGISFAYARSLVTGQGFVAQTGDVPVEGFTNLLWVLTMAGSMWLGIFDQVWMPKLLGIMMAGAAVLLIRRVAHRTWPKAPWAIEIATWLTCLNPAFVIWSASGLENGMTALLVGLACWQLDHSIRDPLPRDAVVSGFLAGLLFANRPDGGLFAAAFPFAILVAGPAPWSRRLGLASLHSLVAVACFGAVTAWRWSTFGDWVPNTFHAKAAGTIWASVQAVGLGSLLTVLLLWVPRFERWSWKSMLVGLAVLGILYHLGARHALWGWFPVVGWILLGLALWYAATRRIATSQRCTIHVFVILALIQSTAIPRDWMGEYRFKTPLYLLVSPFFLGSCCLLFAEMRNRRPEGWPRIRASFLMAASILGTFALFDYGRRALAWRESPVVPLSVVLQTHRTRFEPWARVLATKDVSVLTPDCGGAYWSARLRILDLAGLCDARIARFLSGDREGLAQFILEELKPTFVHMWQSHAWKSGLTEDPHFRADYVGVETWFEVWGSGESAQKHLVGSFVRKDALPEGMEASDLLKFTEGGR